MLAPNINVFKITIGIVGLAHRTSTDGIIAEHGGRSHQHHGSKVIGEFTGSHRGHHTSLGMA